MKIAVYGAGGVGGYFGGRLAEGGADVHLIARGEHLEELQEGQLTVESVHGDFAVDLPATQDPADVGPCDYVLFCVKSFDTISAAQELHPLLKDDTAVISLQNGVSNEEQLAAEIGQEYVVGGVAYIFSTIKEPGAISHTDGPAEIIFGELDQSKTDRIDRFARYCNQAEGLSGKIAENIWYDLWKKYMFICAQSGVTASIRLPIDEIRDVEESWSLFVSILEEVREIAAVEGVEISDETIDEWINFARDLEPGTYSSLHYDLTNGKQMELPALHGTVVEKSEKHGVSVPTTRTIHGILRPWAVRNRK